MPKTKWEETWSKKWKEFSSSIKRTLVVYDKNNNTDICALCGVNADKLGENIKQFISSLRQQDCEALIEMTELAPSRQELRQLIQNYYKEDKCICGEINSRNCPIHQ